MMDVRDEGDGNRLDDAVEIGSGNVFEDLGFNDPGLELAKAGLVRRIDAEIRARGLTQVAAGRLIGLKQPKLSALLRGQWGGYSLDRLVTFLTRFGMDVTVNVSAGDRRVVDMSGVAKTGRLQVAGPSADLA